MNLVRSKKTSGEKSDPEAYDLWILEVLIRMKNQLSLKDWSEFWLFSCEGLIRKKNFTTRFCDIILKFYKAFDHVVFGLCIVKG